MSSCRYVVVKGETERKNTFPCHHSIHSKTVSSADPLGYGTVSANSGSDMKQVHAALACFCTALSGRRVHVFASPCQQLAPRPLSFPQHTKAIFGYGPVIRSVLVNLDFTANRLPDYKGGIWRLQDCPKTTTYRNKTVETNHAIVVEGWAVTQAGNTEDQPAGVEYWIVRNRWASRDAASK